MLGRLMTILASVSCLGCGVEGDVICTTCLSEVAIASWPKEAYPYLAGVSVGAAYDGVVKELVLQLKFHRLRHGAAVAADLLLRGSEPASWCRAGLVTQVTSVPVAASRYRERGYNQSELVAKLVAVRLGLPYYPMLGRATSVHQMGLDRQMRLAQIGGAFYPLRLVRGARVLVVDDVLTTGATLSECASTLLSAGAEQVWGAVVARH